MELFTECYFWCTHLNKKTVVCCELEVNTSVNEISSLLTLVTETYILVLFEIFHLQESIEIKTHYGR